METNNLIFSAQIIGLNPVLIYEKKTYRFIKTYSQICALNSCDKRHSEKLIVNHQMNLNLTDNRQNDLFLTVNGQRDPPPPIETLLRELNYNEMF